MGDRATIQIVNGDLCSPTIYLHWSGYRAMEIIRKAAPFMRAGDISYAFARLAGYCHTETDPTQGLGFGISNSPETIEDDMTGDNGHFQIDLKTGEVTNFNGSVKAVGHVEFGRY